jgi:hypothetical protein
VEVPVAVPELGKAGEQGMKIKYDSIVAIR